MEIIEFSGYEFGFQRGYFSRTGPRTLLWEQHNGPIPKGYVVHHKDSDTKNNTIENLELLTKKQHNDLHRKRSKWTGSEANLRQLGKAGKKAAEWHGSEEGRAFHTVLGRYSWKHRKQYLRNCDMCGKEYTTPYPKRSKWCNGGCRSKSYALDRKFWEKRNCVICEKTFEVFKRSKTRTCSKDCASDLIGEKLTKYHARLRFNNRR